MSLDSASCEIMYTSISPHGDPLAWAVDFFGLQEPDSPKAAPASPDYVPGPEEPEQAPLSLEFDLESELPNDDMIEDSIDSLVDYAADGGDDNDDDDSSDDDKEEEEADEEEEHQAPTNFVVAPAVDPVPSSEETGSFETDESAMTPPPPADHTTPMRVRISIRPQAPMPFLSEAEAERLLTLPTPPPSPLISLLPPSAEERLARCLAAPAHPSPPLPPLPSSLYLPPPVPTSLPLPLPPLSSLQSLLYLPPLVHTSIPLPSPPLPPLPASLLIPPLVDHREDILRPTGGHRADYGFIGTLDAETRRQRAEEVGYGIRDVWVDPTEAVEEVAPTNLEGVNDRVTGLSEVHEEDTHDIYVVTKDVQDRQTHLS
nr:hypothetical protein [Tanacetum cinerariifolium]